MNEIDPGYGWELVESGKGNWKSGDEHWNSKVGWTTLCCDTVPRRRRIDPGEGWEIVSEEQVKIENGRINNFKGWQLRITGTETWKSVDYIHFGLGTFRRLKSDTTRPSCQWVKTSERLPVPKKLVPVFFADHGDGFKAMKAFCYLDNDIDAWLNDEETQCVRAPDYWLDAPDPPNPEPVDEAEEAWLDFCEGKRLSDDRRDAFIAGYNFRAGQQSNKGEK